MDIICTKCICHITPLIFLIFFMSTEFNKNFDGIIWDGIYKSFSEAITKCNNTKEINIWDNQLWLNNQISVMNKSENAIDDKTFIKSFAETNDYMLPYLISGFDLNKQINILDFGGGLGELYLKIKHMVTNADNINFTILENKKIVEVGNLNFANKNLNYVTKVPENTVFDIINFGSSFHYIDDWKSLIKQVLLIKPKYLIFKAS